MGMYISYRLIYHDPFFSIDEPQKYDFMRAMFHCWSLNTASEWLYSGGRSGTTTKSGRQLE
jgi:hypothetical protein